jgi:hypothetical protein
MSSSAYTRCTKHWAHHLSTLRAAVLNLPQFFTPTFRSKRCALFPPSLGIQLSLCTFQSASVALSHSMPLLSNMLTILLLGCSKLLKDGVAGSGDAASNGALGRKNMQLAKPMPLHHIVPSARVSLPNSHLHPCFLNLPTLSLLGN